ncbi:MAG: helix-turn-helix transcriptional regulator [Candidatus Omnitrophota bacterium]|nr:helix-turn-helix transcriptional regulator [Candidatus Omnitrophota bacterium]
MRLPTVVVRGDILESWITVSDYSRSRLATELGVSKGRVSQLLNTHEEPSAHLIAKLLTLTRLPFDRLFKVVRTAAQVSSEGATTTTSSRPRGNGRGVLIQSSESS